MANQIVHDHDVRRRRRGPATFALGFKIVASNWPSRTVGSDLMHRKSGEKGQAVPGAMRTLAGRRRPRLPDCHAVVVTDRAGWHIAARLIWSHSITPMHLPPYSPQLNPVEGVWLHLRERHLSHRLFENYDAIQDASCEACNALLAETGRIASIGGLA